RSTSRTCWRRSAWSAAPFPAATSFFSPASSIPLPFQAILGATPERADGAPVGEGKPIAEVTGSMMRVLIVDDHPVTRDGLRSALSGSKDVVGVGEATSGDEAGEAVRLRTRDAVFVEGRRPGLRVIDG